MFCFNADFSGLYKNVFFIVFVLSQGLATSTLFPCHSHTFLQYNYTILPISLQHSDYILVFSLCVTSSRIDSFNFTHSGATWAHNMHWSRLTL